ncbi:MAG: heterodisulfide reductase [Deltaproteobacteria bacterium]|nr:MAG: heterodisulfide reductase [Deltaproteobacteria bacterium]
MMNTGSAGKINLESIERERVQELLERLGPHKVASCFMCRTCSASCPVTMVGSRFNPLKIIRMVHYGLLEEVLSGESVWLCTSCYSCQERCPQGIHITDFMTALKNMAVKQGHAPAGIRAQMDIVKQAGRIYPLDDFDNKKRAKAGLPELPTSCDVIKELLG